MVGYVALLLIFQIRFRPRNPGYCFAGLLRGTPNPRPPGLAAAPQPDTDTEGGPETPHAPPPRTGGLGDSAGPCGAAVWAAVRAEPVSGKLGEPCRVGGEEEQRAGLPALGFHPEGPVE